MTLFTRVTRLFRADAHALLDQLEAPDVLLAESVREMESAHNRHGQRVRALELRTARARNQITSLGGDIERACSELESCLGAGEDDLARSVIRRRLQLERRLQSHTADLEANEQDLSNARDEYAQQAAALAALREKQDLLQPDTTDPVDPITATVSDDDVEVVLLQEKQARVAS